MSGLLAWLARWLLEPDTALDLDAVLSYIRETILASGDAD